VEDNVVGRQHISLMYAGRGWADNVWGECKVVNNAADATELTVSVEAL